MVGSTGDRIYRYSLSTAYDITTVTYESDSLLLSGQSGAPYGVAFKPDGTQFYSVDGSQRSIFKYTSTANPTLVFPTLEGPTLPLVAGEKAALSIATADGGSTYQIISAQGGIV
jgi:sugar lactone lactonase YvrE